MDGLTLLSEGRVAVLTVKVDGDRLVIRGPRSADAVAQRLLAHKAMILAELTAGNGNTTPANPEKCGGSVDGLGLWDETTEPGTGCPVCGSLESWEDALGRTRCGVCEADTLNKALRLVERAARLRKRGQPRKPAPRIAPRCVPASSVDTQTSGRNGP